MRLSAAGQRDEAHDLFDAHLPLLRYEQQPGVGLAVRKYVLMRRGILTSDAQRAARRGAVRGDARRGRLPARAPRPAGSARGVPASLSPPRRHEATFVRRMPAAPGSAHSGTPANRLARKSTNTRTLAERCRRLGYATTMSDTGAV